MRLLDEVRRLVLGLFAYERGQVKIALADHFWPTEERQTIHIGSPGLRCRVLVQAAIDLEFGRFGIKCDLGLLRCQHFFTRVDALGAAGPLDVALELLLDGDCGVKDAHFNVHLGLLLFVHFIC